MGLDWLQDGSGGGSWRGLIQGGLERWDRGRRRNRVAGKEWKRGRGMGGAGQLGRDPVGWKGGGGGIGAGQGGWCKESSLVKDGMGKVINKGSKNYMS